MFNDMKKKGYSVDELYSMPVVVGETMTFKQVADMFLELGNKGYKVEEILQMPIEIGEKEVIA